MALYPEHGPKDPPLRPRQTLRVPEAFSAGRLLRRAEPTEPPGPASQAHRRPRAFHTCPLFRGRPPYEYMAAETGEAGHLY